MKFTQTGLALAAIILVSACAHHHPAKEDVTNQEVEAQPMRSSHGEIAAKGFQSIRESQSLTAEEKEKLLAIHSRMAIETMKIQEETSKLKGVLFETVTKRPFNSAKVEGIKKRLIQLNDMKMKNMFGALEEVKKVVQNQPDKDYQEIFRPFLMEQVAY